MVDAIGPKKIQTIVKINPVAERDEEEQKRKREKHSGNSPSVGGEKKLGNNIDERC